MSGIRINRSLSIPDHELDYRFTTSGGPGGQHANKASTRVELSWNVTRSQALGARQRQRIVGALRTRIDKEGNLRLTSDRHRSQMQNRNDVVERFRVLIADALVPPKPRVRTRPTKASRERRLEDKKRRSATKRARNIRSRDL